MDSLPLLAQSPNLEHDQHEHIVVVLGVSDVLCVVIGERDKRENLHVFEWEKKGS